MHLLLHNSRPQRWWLIFCIAITFLICTVSGNEDYFVESKIFVHSVYSHSLFICCSKLRLNGLFVKVPNKVPVQVKKQKKKTKKRRFKYRPSNMHILQTYVTFTTNLNRFYANLYSSPGTGSTFTGDHPSCPFIR